MTRFTDQVCPTVTRDALGPSMTAPCWRSTRITGDDFLPPQPSVSRVVKVIHKKHEPLITQTTGKTIEVWKRQPFAPFLRVDSATAELAFGSNGSCTARDR